MMFKIMILQRFYFILRTKYKYNISDDQVEYQINDRMSFTCALHEVRGMRFLDLSIADDVPDSKTIWLFRERLTDLELVEELFSLFLSKLVALNLIANEGKILDASFVEVPRQRNTCTTYEVRSSREENEQIKDGKIPERFEKNPHIKSQKDTDARWTKKNKISYFGYKDHVKQDSKSKLITAYSVTSANVHDSQQTDTLLNDSTDQTQVESEPFYADSAYSGEPQEQIVAKNKMVNQVCEKGARNRPLTDAQKASNREKSRVRSRVEHIFGFTAYFARSASIENSMNQMYIQCIGIKRATAIIGLMNLTYNTCTVYEVRGMFRKIQLMPV
jgi:IS5 family transposase